jgi:prepilin-type N-terminal cleavage/methylation domain-containing protein
MRKERGMTLLEILATMMIFTLVASGLLAAFTFARSTGWRNRLWMQGLELAREVYEKLPDDFSLNPGIYVDENMQHPPQSGNTQPAKVTALNFPANFQRFQTDPGQADTFFGHGDGRLYVVEGTEDIDQDGYTGFDFDGDGRADLLRVRVKVKWTAP